ncbi:MAG TPA: hypothetical protein VGP53_11325, partial [Acidimicrobiales bacterium]|nr:hypothetical protein [Acidimicrobiales bacterium]
MPAWPLAEGAKSPASPDEATPAIHNEPTPPADGLDEPTPAPDRPDEQAPPPADGVEAPTASASQPPPPAEV